MALDGKNGLEIVGLSPYWFNVVQGGAVHNTVEMQSLFLLTGPNGGGKSSLLRSIGAAALLGICGLMVPAESATIPHFDSIMLHMKSYDSPADGKSSFQVFFSVLSAMITNGFQFACSITLSKNIYMLHLFLILYCNKSDTC